MKSGGVGRDTAAFACRKMRWTEESQVWEAPALRYILFLTYLHKLADLELKHNDNQGNTKIKKSLVIKIPKNAIVKLDVRYGSFKIPDNLNTVD